MPSKKLIKYHISLLIDLFKRNIGLSEYYILSLIADHKHGIHGIPTRLFYISKDKTIRFIYDIKIQTLYVDYLVWQKINIKNREYYTEKAMNKLCPDLFKTYPINSIVCSNLNNELFGLDYYADIY